MPLLRPSISSPVIRIPFVSSSLIVVDGLVGADAYEFILVVRSGYYVTIALRSNGVVNTANQYFYGGAFEYPPHGGGAPAVHQGGPSTSWPGLMDTPSEGQVRLLVTGLNSVGKTIFTGVDSRTYNQLNYNFSLWHVGATAFDGVQFAFGTAGTGSLLIKAIK